LLFVASNDVVDIAGYCLLAMFFLLYFICCELLCCYYWL